MTCHWQQDYDYSPVHAAALQCTDGVRRRASATVEACASCHRNHGTPYQWELAPTGKAAKRSCMTCHMQLVERPVAVGEEPRRVRSHVFPGCRSEKQLRRAYRYDARIEGNEVVVTIENKGAGHNFPTELKQRAVESLIVVRDRDGAEVARSRMVFRDPYKRPYGLKLPVNTQIPAGQSREHRVPIGVASGTADCELHFKQYFPIEDHHPDLARQLENHRLTFEDIAPNLDPVDSAPEVSVVVPEAIPAEAASPANLVDFARPEIGTVDIELPEGSDDTAIAELISMFQFPVPEGNRLARERLVEIGVPALPALVETMGSWDNKTWKQGMAVLAKIGEPAEEAVIGALESDQLYVRIHSRQLLPKLAFAGRRDAMLRALRTGLDSRHALDRASTAEALGAMGDLASADGLRALLRDRDPDAVRAAAFALAGLDVREAADDVVAAMRRAHWDETRRDLAHASALLGAADGVPILLQGLDHDDDLIREDFFEALFAVTGVHLGYDPLAPRPERLEAIGALQAWWAKSGGTEALRRPHRPSARTHAHAWHLVSSLGGGAGTVAGGEDAATLDELIGILVKGLIIGIGGTIALDIWAMTLQVVAKTPATNWAMVGRWLGHIPSGRFKHENVGSAEPIVGEAALGWAFHYAIGMGYGLLLLLVCGSEWLASPTVLPAVLLSLALLVAPFFVMMPGLGFGVAGSKTPKPNVTRLKSLLGHTMFGLGMYVTALLAAP